MCFPSIHNHDANISYNFKINSKIKNQLQLYPSFRVPFKLVLEIKRNAIYLFIRSYLRTWGDHSVRSIVLPWYPGGHVLSKMQGRHLYLQDRHGGIPKEKT